MISRTLNSLQIKENPHNVDVRAMYNASSAQIMHITLKPGQALKPHKTPVDVAFYILEGAPVIHIGDESETFEKDSLIESPANLVHYISNNSAGLARILVIKAPRPESPTKVL